MVNASRTAARMTMTLITSERNANPSGSASCLGVCIIQVKPDSGSLKIVVWVSNFPGDFVLTSTSSGL
ncbi:Uncharacterised protein [Mycobacteroides abscessus subsp. abscessus]|nr:Uncharacterised protein [Mycobacteroides abscessus subsp. abscessus]